MVLPHGGAIIGEIYTYCGEPINHRHEIHDELSPAEIRKQIVDNYWGDYVLVLPEIDDPEAISVMRSPSPASTLPCFYSTQTGVAFFTSSILLAEKNGLYRKRVNYDHLTHRLIYPGIKTSATGLADVKELLPGCTVHLRGGEFKVGQSWDPWKFVCPQMRYSDPGEAVRAIREAVAMVVTTWATRDGSALLELSGGLDSSIVGVCLKNTSAKISCATLTSPVPGADERDYAELIAKMLGTDLTAKELRYGDAPIDFHLPPDLTTPLVGPLQFAIDKIMEAIAEQHDANSYYSGAGGDTVFCYLTNASPAADAFRSAGLAAGIRAIHDISTFHQCTYWTAGRLTLRKLLQNRNKHHASDHSFLRREAPTPEREDHPWLSTPPNAFPGDRDRIAELAATQLYPDSCPRGLTRKFRMPLLSQPVIEACLRAPSWMWFSGGQNRALAREAFSDLLPQPILMRKSKGTFTAYLGALYRRKIDHMVAFLLDGELHARGLVDGGKIRKLAQEEVPRGDNSFARIFQLCAMENWIRQQSSARR
nr:asparagine synthase C-terminal domain-containing protein [Paenibacillus dendritiformis]